MLTDSSKVYLEASGLGLVLAIAYGVLTGDAAGIVLFLALAVAAAMAGGVMSNQRDLPVTVGDAPPALRPVAPVPAPGGGAWPLLGAVAVTLVAAGLVLGAPVLVGGLVLALATTVGWLARVSSERSGRPADLLPAALPVLGLFFIASLIFFISRILLAVPEQASTIIALLVAVAILGGASLVASRPSIPPRSLAVALALVGVLLVAGGVVAAAVGERPEELKGAAAREKEAKDKEREAKAAGVAPVTVTAKAIAFGQPEISLKANSPVEIRFDNQDAGTPHNVAIAAAPDFANVLFRGEIVTGPKTVDYRFTAPAAGTYVFRCDVHTNMQGKVTVA